MEKRSKGEDQLKLNTLEKALAMTDFTKTQFENIRKKNLSIPVQLYQL